MPALSQAQRKLFQIAEHNPKSLYKKNRGVAKLPHKTLHDFAATKGKLPKRLHKKTRVIVDNRMSDLGQEIDHPNGKHTIKINVRAHKHNKRELLDTLHEEKYHSLHPKATEKKAKAATRRAMKNMTPKQAKSLLSMLPKVHRKTGAEMTTPTADDNNQSIVHLANSLAYNIQHINGHTQQAMEVAKKLEKKMKNKPELNKHAINLKKISKHSHASS